MTTLRPARALLLVWLLIGVLSCSDDTTAPPPDENDPNAVGAISTWAGTGHAGYDGDGNTLRQSTFYMPIDVEFTPTLGTYIVDWNNHRLRRLNPNGTLETVVGRVGEGDGPLDLSDLTPAGSPGKETFLNHPTDVFERANGRLAIVCWHNHKVREWDPATDRVWVLVGREANCGGDGGPCSEAKLNQPPKAVEASDGSLYIVDQKNQVVRKIDPAGIITTVVAEMVCPTPSPYNDGGFGGDGGDPRLARIKQPPIHVLGGGLAMDAQDRLYIADPMNHRIRRVDFAANIIETVVGNGAEAYSGDGGDPLLASLNMPADIEFGPDGRLFIADRYNHAVRAVDFTANVITTVAGTGKEGFGGDGGPAVEARLNHPLGIAFDADGHLYIADTVNNRIRRVKMHE
jgi:hypothetical protein